MTETCRAIKTLIEDNLEKSDLIRSVKTIDNSHLLVECNFAQAATLYVTDNIIYIEADNKLKSLLSKEIIKLINNRNKN